MSRVARVSGLVVLAFCLLVPPQVQAGTIVDLGNGVIHDTTAGKMWMAHGIGFASSYPYPDLANTWIAQLNTTALGAGYDDWRIPTVTLDGQGMAQAGTGELPGLHAGLTVWDPSRTAWPFGVGSMYYGGMIIFTNQAIPSQPGNYWGYSFGRDAYVPVSTQWAYAYVGTLAVREADTVPGGDDPPAVPEPATLLLVGAGLAGIRAVRGRQRR